jgi:hypothetical protein
LALALDRRDLEPADLAAAGSSVGEFGVVEVAVRALHEVDRGFLAGAALPQELHLRRSFASTV